MESSFYRDKQRNKRIASEIDLAVHHQDRIRFHGNARIKGGEYSAAEADFKRFVQNLIPNDKYKTFLSLMRYPLITNEIADTCFSRLARIFDGRNPVFNYSFADLDLRNDWQEYRTKILREPTVWSVDGWSNYRNEINSILVVDVASQTDENGRPQPYFYWLPISAVTDFEAESNGQLNYLMFAQGEDKMAVIDGDAYRVFSRNGSQLGSLILEVPHSLGYCPARFFVTESIDPQHPHVKKSPLTTCLSALDWYLFFGISKQHLDIYGSYPIYSGYAQDCNFSNETGDYCDGGYLRDASGSWKYDVNGQLMQCPKCGEHRIAGAGSFVEIPIPDGESQPDLRNPVQMLSIDANSLKYNVEEVERLRSKIIDQVCGANDGLLKNESVNETQVNASFETQSSILNCVKKTFETAQQWVDDTICRLRYGSDYISCDVNYGTEFFLLSATELRQRYKTAKESGASSSELDELSKQIVETEYRNNETAKKRIQILQEIEPFPTATTEEVVQYIRDGVATAEELKIKVNLPSLIRRFERENMDVVAFVGDDLANKINIINQTIQSYVRQISE